MQTGWNRYSALSQMVGRRDRDLVPFNKLIVGEGDMSWHM